MSGGRYVSRAAVRNTPEELMQKPHRRYTHQTLYQRPSAAIGELGLRHLVIKPPALADDSKPVKYLC
jgi:hypothetical protein